jgi:hypothetical protein
MRSLKGIVGIIALSSFVALGAGCSANKELEKLADKACACKDKDCATGVANEVADWFVKNKDARGDTDKAQQDLERMMKCFTDKGADMTKFMDTMSKLE